MERVIEKELTREQIFENFTKKVEKSLDVIIEEPDYKLRYLIDEYGTPESWGYELTPEGNAYSMINYDHVLTYYPKEDKMDYVYTNVEFPSEIEPTKF